MDSDKKLRSYKASELSVGDVFQIESFPEVLYNFRVDGFFVGGSGVRLMVFYSLNTAVRNYCALPDTATIYFDSEATARITLAERNL